MRKIKGIVAIVVVMTTIVSLFAFSMISVSAEDSFSEVNITDSERLIVEKLKALGVISNEYMHASYVTRREMAEIIRTYMKLPTEASGSGKNNFNDVKTDDPAYGAINALRDLEVITGDENNNFRPEDYLNYNEAVVFIINAVGHKYFAEREGGYPTGYMRMAIKFHMLDELRMVNGESLVPVIDVYKMLDKALDAATIIPQYYGDGSVRYTISETDTFLSENYGVRKYRGTVTGNEFTNITSDAFELKREQIQISNVIYDTPGYYYGYLLGYAVDYYIAHTNDGDELVYVEETPKKNSTIKIDSEDILRNKITSSRIYYEEDGKEKEQHIDIDGVVDVIYNNQYYGDYGTLRSVMPLNGYVEALDKDNNGSYEVLFVYDYTVAVVESVDSYEEKIYDKITNQEIDLTTNVRRVDVITADTKTPVPFATIRKNDVLNIAMGRGSEKVVTIYVSDQKISGKITGYASDLGYEIKDEYYKITYNYDTEINSERIFPALTVGDNVTICLDMNGKIAAANYSTTDDASLLAAVAGVDYNENSTMNRDVKMKLFTADGKFIEAPFAEGVKVDGVKYDMEDVNDCDRVLNIISAGHTEGGKYAVYDSYVVRYMLSKEGEITYLDTGAVGGPGNLNAFADHWPFCATRISIVLLAPRTTNIPEDAVFAGISSDLVVFTTPVAGELSDETGYSVTNSWRNDHSFANPANRNGNFPGTTTTLMDNLSAYHLEQDDSLVMNAAIIRGGGISEGVSDDSGLYIITEMTSSVDADGMTTKTLYQDDEKIGQLAQMVTVNKSETSTQYTIDALISSGVIADGSVVRCGLDNDGYIGEIAVISDYDASTGEIVPTFAGNGVYVGSPHMYAMARTNIAIGEIKTYDSKNNCVDFVCGTYNYKGTLSRLQSFKIYDTSTGKIRNAAASEIRDGDKCILRLQLYYSIYDMIIFR